MTLMETNQPVSKSVAAAGARIGLGDVVVTTFQASGHTRTLQFRVDEKSLRTVSGVQINKKTGEPVLHRGSPRRSSAPVWLVTVVRPGWQTLQAAYAEHDAR